PEKAPDKMPTSVMPIWTEERKRPGSSARRIAIAAPLLPCSAITLRRADREETTASSDIAKAPFTMIRTATIRISVSNKVQNWHAATNGGVLRPSHYRACAARVNSRGAMIPYCLHASVNAPLGLVVIGDRKSTRLNS